jgi:hypothetical protein
MSMAPVKGGRLSILILAGAFVLAGVAVGFRRLFRSSERRRLKSLGVVESHRQARPHDGN